MPTPENGPSENLTTSRYCTGCAGRGHTWDDLDVLNRMPRKLTCNRCGGNPQQPWRLHWSTPNWRYEYRHLDTGEVRPYVPGEGYPDA